MKYRCNVGTETAGNETEQGVVVIVEGKIVQPEVIPGSYVSVTL
jgi:hypothetical protein